MVKDTSNKILLHRGHVSVPTCTHTALDKYNRKENKLPAHQHWSCKKNIQLLHDNSILCYVFSEHNLVIKTQSTQSYSTLKFGKSKYVES